MAETRQRKGGKTLNTKSTRDDMACGASVVTFVLLRHGEQKSNRQHKPLCL